MRRFLAEARPGRATAAAALRRVFVAMYVGQLAIAAVVAIVVLSFVEIERTGSTTMGAVLVALALVESLLGAVLPGALARSGGRGEALSATLLAGVLLATPGWFLMFSLATVQPLVVQLLLFSILVVAYGLGFMLTGRIAVRVASRG